MPLKAVHQTIRRPFADGAIEKTNRDLQTMAVEIECPEDFQGTVVGDVIRRRGIMSSNDMETIELNENVVLMGRGSGPSRHSGNILFRETHFTRHHHSVRRGHQQ